MLCNACRDIDLDGVVDEGGFELHPSYNALKDSAVHGCALCKFLCELLPLYKCNLDLCEVQRVEISSGEWVGGAERAFAPLSSLFPMKLFNKKLATLPVVLRVHETDIESSSEMGIRFVQVAIPDFHREGDMQYDVLKELEFFAHEDDPLASCVRGRPIEASCKSDTSFELVASWLEGCLKNHKSCRSNHPTKLPTRVLDLKRLDHTLDISLFETKGRSGKWLALSHCWGAPGSILRTTVQTLRSHLNRIRFESLPPKFQDAITITRELGYQYLWIDSLCIIQDSVDDWRSEAAQMYNVYQNATLTIMAEASSDSSTGIFRSGDSQRRNKFNAICVPGIGSNAVDRGHFYVRQCLTPGYDSKTPLRTRGWVLQEDLLSIRTLKYSSEQMFWACRTLRSCEADPDSDHRQDDIFDQRRPVEEVAYTHVSEYEDPKDYLEWWYSEVVDDFTHRKLTVTTDALPAIGGIARQVQESTGFTYLAGLWLEDIRRGLLWISSGQGVRNQPYSAPSWSWASMTFDLGESTEREWIYDYIVESSSWEYGAEIVSHDIKRKSGDMYGEVDFGSLLVRGYWKGVDKFPNCPRPFFNSVRDRRVLYQRDEPLDHGNRSFELLSKQIVCSHDVVAGLEGRGPNIFGKGIVYLMILKSGFGFGQERDDSDDDSDDADEDGTIWALMLEPTGRRNTYRRIGVAQIPEDDGMADDGWQIGELTIV